MKAMKMSTRLVSISLGLCDRFTTLFVDVIHVFFVLISCNLQPCDKLITIFIILQVGFEMFNLTRLCASDLWLLTTEISYVNHPKPNTLFYNACFFSKWIFNHSLAKKLCNLCLRSQILISYNGAFIYLTSHSVSRICLTSLEIFMICNDNFCLLEVTTLFVNDFQWKMVYAQLDNQSVAMFQQL